ncbi:hypothetical protein GCM10022225_66570 [Plantactinospora mayteni]|uniref:Uncharacterized protein n=1 Tax=Plantactinospora mayteni TaxID=566021 RepID=A0ABQ4EPG9_9ACTN|nr:hypothetical protein [Plantactinospora mayteni]GIG96562.1 hypothetical protein Pma05_31350 [Plantactinospora mayteni]
METTEPGWRPEYRGADGSVGDVGSGRELGAHLYYLYRSGRNELPQIAKTYADVAVMVHRTAGAMEGQFDLPERGIGPAQQRLLELRAEVQDVLRLTSLRMSEVGAALVTIADRYAATDEGAAKEFSRLLGNNASDYERPALAPPDPPAPGDPPLADPRIPRNVVD